MDLNFEIGDPRRPRGHAILYFRVDTEPDSVYATYIVTLPIVADLTKYVPPFLSAQLGAAGENPLASFSAFAMPPMSEVVDGGYDHLVRLANRRNDDLLYGGSMFSYDLARMMEAVAGAVKSYSDAWSDAAPAPAATPPDDLALVGAGVGGGAGRSSLPGGADAGASDSESESDGMGVNEVLWSFMSESDRLGEMGRLLGRLRFAQEGNDAADIADITADMTALGRRFPAEFNIANLIAAASDASAPGAHLAQLYLQRCYSLSAGDAEQVRRLDGEIAGAGGGPTG